jgi:hypothetical protein
MKNITVKMWHGADEADVRRCLAEESKKRHVAMTIVSIKKNNWMSFTGPDDAYYFDVEVEE